VRAACAADICGLADGAAMAAMAADLPRRPPEHRVRPSRRSSTEMMRTPPRTDQPRMPRRTILAALFPPFSTKPPCGWSSWSFSTLGCKNLRTLKRDSFFGSFFEASLKGDGARFVPNFSTPPAAGTFFGGPVSEDTAQYGTGAGAPSIARGAGAPAEAPRLPGGRRVARACPGRSAASAGTAARTARARAVRERAQRTGAGRRGRWARAGGQGSALGAGVEHQIDATSGASRWSQCSRARSWRD